MKLTTATLETAVSPTMRAEAKVMKNGAKTVRKSKSGFDGPSPDVGKATQFKPGNKGGGRPRTAKFAEAVRQIAAEIGKDGRTGAQRLAEHCFKRAMKGSVRHLELFLHYAEGKPVTRSEEELFPPEQPSRPLCETGKFENASATELEAFREKLLRGEILEIPPKSKPN
jgi:hypothetical protein